MERLRQLGSELQAITQANGGISLRVVGFVMLGNTGLTSDLIDINLSDDPSPRCFP